MGAIIYPSGELVVSDHTNEGVPEDLAEKAAGEIAEMKDRWGNPIFKRDGYTVIFADELIEGCNPVKDYIEAPLKQAIEIAKNHGAFIDGDIFISSDWNDYDNIHISIEENKVSYRNSEVSNASDEELIAELERRGYGIFSKNGTYRDVVKAILPISCDPYIDGIMETNQIDIGSNDFFIMKAPKRWWDARYGSFEEKDEEMEDDSEQWQ